MSPGFLIYQVGASSTYLTGLLARLNKAIVKALRMGLDSEDMFRG